MTGYWQLAPEALLLAAAIAALFGEVLPGRDRGTAYLGAGVTLLAAVLVAAGGTSQSLWNGMLVFDGLARFVRIAVALLTGIWLLWVAGRGLGRHRVREAVALALVSATGGMLLASARELVTFFLAVELSTMPAYVLVGYRRRDVAGLEGTLKYFLLSLLTSMVMLYGLSFLYGLSGSTFYGQIAALPTRSPLVTIAAVLVLVGLFAKLSAAPFHYWAPDAYAGASAAAVAFVSTVPKLAGTAAAVRLVSSLPAPTAVIAGVVAIGAAASMLLGNLAALTQVDIRRLMAYSGVAHTGYALVAVAALGSAANAAGSAVFYALAYSVPSLAIMLVAAEEGVGLGNFGDLVTRRPVVTLTIVAMLLSLVGIPPFVGFFGKLYAFGAGIAAGMTWLVIVGVVASVVSAAYYFRIVRSMFFGHPDEGPATPEGAETTPEEDTAAAEEPGGLVYSAVLPEDAAPEPPVRSIAASLALAACLIATVALGVFARIPVS